MAISANTLFHFTNLEGLKGILSSSGFYCQYSREYFGKILSSRSQYRWAYIPMTCFCDLTISQLANDGVHRKSFGDYGIGLTKEWGIKNGVSPVLYVHQHSQQSKLLRRMPNSVAKLSKKVDEFVIHQIRDELIDSIKNIKPYQGNWQKGRRLKKKINYYNEREWRFSPPLLDHPVLSGTISENKLKTRKINNILKKDPLTFKVQDIKYIITKSKRIVSEISNTIINNNKLEIADQFILLSKIISFEEIEEDFG